MMKISIGSDHRGFELKKNIIKKFINVDWLDVGTNSKLRVDYPVFAKKVVNNILNNSVEFGILICSSGIGMSIAANRYQRIYAALCWNKDIAKASKRDDRANILVLPADFVSLDIAYEIIRVWFSSKFKGGRYEKRLDMIDQ